VVAPLSPAVILKNGLAHAIHNSDSLFSSRLERKDKKIFCRILNHFDTSASFRIPSSKKNTLRGSLLKFISTGNCSYQTICR
jgi:hypothetical protein